MKIRCGSINLVLGDPIHNAEEIKEEIESGIKNKVDLLVFSELCLTGYNCKDLFNNQQLLNKTLEGIQNILDFTKEKDIVVIVGAPIKQKSKLYDCALVIYNGEIVGANYRKILKDDKFDNSLRFFSNDEIGYLDIFSLLIRISSVYNLGNKINFKLVINENLNEVSSDESPIIINPTAEIETVKRGNERIEKIKNISNLFNKVYVYCAEGKGESTTDNVFVDDKIIAMNGKILKSNPDGADYSIDLDFLNHKQIYEELFVPYFHFKSENMEEISKYPYLEDIDIENVCSKILDMQGKGMIQKMKAMNRQKVILGVSGGLDSTCSLLSLVSIFKKYNLDLKNIIGVQMPGFGTSERTYNNSLKLMKALGITSMVIDIKDVMTRHLKNIGQPEGLYDLTYEQTQSRERTQILLDLVNKENGIMLGTGCMSEFALGWMTYSGDHLSMYAFNVGLPKTMVKILAKWFLKHTKNEDLKECLSDIIDTPVSPELLPLTNEGKQDEHTEELIGQYEIQDFFIYYIMNYNFGIKKIFELTCQAFPNYDKKRIFEWLKIFTNRYFTRQYKKNCFNDGIQVFDYSLSPRGAYQMASDISNRIWKDELSEIEKELEEGE